MVNNLSIVHIHMQATEKAKSMELAYISLLDNSTFSSSRDYIKGFINLGRTYRESNLDSTFYYLNLALKLSLTENTYHLENIYNQLAFSFQENNQLDSAEKYFHRSIKQFEKTRGKRHPSLTYQYIHLAEIYHQKGDFEKSITYYDQVFLDQIEGYKRSDYQVVFSLEKVKFDYSVLWALVQRTELLTDISNQKESDIDLKRNIFQSWEIAIDLIDKMRQSYITKGAKQFVLNERLNVFENGIKASLALYELTDSTKYLERAFQFSERSKANLLRENLLKAENQSFSGIPKSLQELENSLKREVAFYTQKLWEAKSKNDSSNIQVYQFYSFNKKQSLDSLKQQIREAYPEYFTIMYNRDPISIKTVQQKLSNEAQFLEYFSGEDFYYLFSITKNDFQIIPIPKNNKSDSLILALHKNLTNYQEIINNSNLAAQTFQTSAALLFELFLSPALSDHSIKKLTIIPDGLMGLIPFEVLLTQSSPNTKIDFLNLDYLLKKYRIGYHFSAELWVKSQEVNIHRGENTCLAMAPYDFDDEVDNKSSNQQAVRSINTELSFSGEEINTINKYFSGEFHLAAAATKSVFFEDVKNHQIIHLATHSIPDSVYPMNARLAFYQQDSTQLDDQFLYAYELTSLDIKADLVVLSACETGVGKFYQGEGIASLGRGFMSAGAKSIVMSLWKIEDRASNFLMGEFYRLLAEGNEKDEALRQAKLNYLQQADPFNAHPFFWAGFISIGNTSAIVSHSYLNWLFLAILGLFSIGLIFFIKKRKKN